MQVETQENMKSLPTGVRKSSEENSNDQKQNKRMKLSHPLEGSKTDGNSLLASNSEFVDEVNSFNSAVRSRHNFEEQNISDNPNSPRNNFEQENVSDSPRNHFEENYNLSYPNNPVNHFEEQQIHSPKSPRNHFEEEQNILYSPRSPRNHLEEENTILYSPKSPRNQFEEQNISQDSNIVNTSYVGEQNYFCNPRSPKSLLENEQLFYNPRSPKILNCEMSDSIHSNDPYPNGSLNDGDNSNIVENFNNEIQENINRHLNGENIHSAEDNITNEYLNIKVMNKHETGENIANQQLREQITKEHLIEKNIIIGNLLQEDSTDRDVLEENINNQNTNYRTVTNENNLDNDSTTMDVCDAQELQPPILKIQCNDNEDNYSSNTSIASDISPACLQDLDEEASKKELPCPSLVNEVLNSSKLDTSSQACNSHQGVAESPETVTSVAQSQENIIESLKTDDVKYLGIYDLKATVLEGHADIVFSVAADDKVVISSSGDTTIKVWNVEEQKEIGNFAGHSDAVTSIILLNSQQSETLNKKLDVSPATSIALSASMDCHIKVWSVYDSKEIASVYTFNSITCMGYLESDSCVALGTEGGKLEVWDLSAKKMLDSVLAHECPTSVLKVLDNYIFTASTDGAVKVWLFEEGEIQPLYSRRRREKSTDGVDVGPTQWKTLCVSNDTIFLGDCTPFLKVLDWKLGRLSLLVNQLGKDGVCEAIFAKDNILLSSSYDRNTDTAAINVWSLPDIVYVGTLTGDIQDICCLAISRINNKLRIVSGGHQLVVWDFNLKEPSKDSESAMFSFCEIDGIGVETNEVSTRSLHSSFSGSSSAVNIDVSEDKRSRCNII